MKKIISLSILVMCVIFVSCFGNSQSNSKMTKITNEFSNTSESNALKKTPSDEQDVQIKDETMPTVNMKIGDKNFTVILYDNDSTKALLEKLPLTLNMDDLNGNEKFYYFSENFPANSERVGNIKTGDLMLYGSDCLVLFYESFSTSYSYTKLGYVEDVSGLAKALGSGSVEVSFDLN